MKYEERMLRVVMNIDDDIQEQREAKARLQSYSVRPFDPTRLLPKIGFSMRALIYHYCDRAPYHKGRIWHCRPF